MSKKVAIVWRYLADYRVPFYRGLKEYLAQRDIELKLIFGPTNGNGPADDVQIALPWANCVSHWSISVGGLRFAGNLMCPISGMLTWLLSSKQTDYCLTIG